MTSLSLEGSGESERKSPLLRAIHRLTSHPSEPSVAAIARESTANTPPMSREVGSSTGKSPLLHAIHVLTNDPDLYVHVSEEAGKVRGRMVSAAHGTGAFAVGVAGTALLLAAAKVIADKTPDMRDSFQQKWASLELQLSGLCEGAVNRTAQLGQPLTQYAKQHQAELRTAGTRALKVLLVGMSLCALKTGPGQACGKAMLLPLRLMLSPTCLVAATASTALLSHKPALGVRDPYKRARSQLTAASGVVCDRIEAVAKSPSTRKAVYSVLGVRALTQRKAATGSPRAKMLIPAALAAACAEGYIRVVTDQEPESVRVRREACMKSMQARSAVVKAQVSAHWLRVSHAVQELVSAGRSYCEKHPGSKRGVQAALVIAILLSAAAIKRSGRALPDSAAASEAFEGSASALQNAAAAAAATVKNLAAEYSVPEWLQGSLERLQVLVGQGVDAAKAAGSTVGDRAAQVPALRGLSDSASGAAKSFGERLASGAGAVKEEAAVISRGVAQHASAAGGAFAAGAAAAAGSTMSAAKSAPGFFTGALSQAPDFAQHVPRHVIDAAKQVPEAASSAWESLVTALQRSSQLADEAQQVKAAERAIKEAASRAAAADPKGLDVLAHAVLRPELLLYGAIAAEMHMRGMLPGVNAMRSSPQAAPGPGMTVTGRDVISGVKHAVKGTQSCVRAVSGAVERARMLPFVFSSARASRTASGVPRAIAAPHQVTTGANITIATPAPKKSLEQPLTNGGTEDSLAALQGMQHVLVTHTADGSKYVGGNPPWMINGLAGTGLLKDKSAKRQAVATNSKLLTTVQDTIARTCTPPHTSLGNAQELFTLEEGFSHLNHGSYGATLKASQQAAGVWRSALDSSPSHFMEEVAVPALAAAVSSAAEMIGAEGRDCVPVTNATTGITTVLAAVPLSVGDAILTLSCAYSAVKTAVGRAAASAGASVVEVEFDMECVLDQQELVRRVTAVLEKSQGRIKAAVLDHIVSFPPVVLPLTELIAACRTASCVSIIDGAHAIGNLPDLDITRYTLHPDAYVTNLHKWLCAPKGTALLWVSEALQGQVKPLVVSHAEGLGFAAEHLWTGTADLSPWLAVPAAIDVHKALGVSASHEHRAHTLEQGVAALVKAFRLGPSAGGLPVVIGGTGVPPGSSDSPILDLASFPSMAAVRLPELLTYPATPFAAQDLRTVLRHEHSIEAPIIAWDGALWVRVSSAVYTTKADFEALAAAIVSIQAVAGDATNTSSTQAPKPPLTGRLKPHSSGKDALVFQSIDSDTSAGIPEVNKSVRDFYGSNPLADLSFSQDLFSSKDVLRASSGHLTDHLVGCGIDDDDSAVGDQAASKEDSAMEPVKPASIQSSPGKVSVHLEEKPSPPTSRGPALPLTKDVGDLHVVRGLCVDGELLPSPKGGEFSAIERCGRSTIDSDSSK